MVRSKAFTLVEVLVVTLIVATLMGLLFPIIARAKQQAYLTQDVQQMRQVYVAIELYRQDSNDEYPPTLVNSETYAGSTSVYVSPVDPFRNGVPGLKDFPAEMYILPDGYSGASLRSPFRISYGYLHPMAILRGDSEAWFHDAVSNPAAGLVSMKMYNEVAQFQSPPFGVDLCRWNLIDYRICVDGSFYEYHFRDGVGPTCSLHFCFGPGLPLETWLGGP